MSDQDRREEAIMFAMMELGRQVNYPADGFQERYCANLGPIAKRFDITEAELSEAFMRHYGPSFMQAMQGTDSADAK